MIIDIESIAQPLHGVISFAMVHTGNRIGKTARFKRKRRSVTQAASQYSDIVVFKFDRPTSS